MFLVNSRYRHFTATPRGFGREDLHPRGHTFSRSYGANLPSSLTRVLSSALEYSSHLPVSVCGTVAAQLHSRLFLEAWNQSLASHLSVMLSRLSPTRPKRAAYVLSPLTKVWLTYPSPSPLASTLRAGTGIFACFPSPTPLGLDLGSDSPQED